MSEAQDKVTPLKMLKDLVQAVRDEPSQKQRAVIVTHFCIWHLLRNGFSVSATTKCISPETCDGNHFEGQMMAYINKDQCVEVCLQHDRGDRSPVFETHSVETCEDRFGLVPIDPDAPEILRMADLLIEAHNGIPDIVHDNRPYDPMPPSTN